MSDLSNPVSETDEEWVELDPATLVSDLAPEEIEVARAEINKNGEAWAKYRHERLQAKHAARQAEAG